MPCRRSSPATTRTTRRGDRGGTGLDAGQGRPPGPERAAGGAHFLAESPHFHDVAADRHVAPATRAVAAAVDEQPMAFLVGALAHPRELITQHEIEGRPCDRPQHPLERRGRAAPEQPCAPVINPEMRGGEQRLERSVERFERGALRRDAASHRRQHVVERFPQEPRIGEHASGRRGVVGRAPAQQLGGLALDRAHARGPAPELLKRGQRFLLTGRAAKLRRVRKVQAERPADQRQALRIGHGRTVTNSLGAVERNCNLN